MPKRGGVALLADEGAGAGAGAGGSARGAKGPRVERLADYVNKNVFIVAQPPLSIEAFNALMDVKHLAGHQKGKDRGTLQSDTLLALEAQGGVLGDWLASTNKLVEEECDGVTTNEFANFNHGASAADGSGAKKLKHRDLLTEGPDDARTTHRLIGYYPRDKGQRVGLTVYGWGEEVDIFVPHGCSLLATGELLAHPDLLHAHSGNGGINVSIVKEVHIPADVELASASPTEMAAASAAQPPLPFDEAFPSWQPAKDFLGPILKWGFGGSMTVRRWAMSLTWGPKFKRVMTNKEARCIIAAMSEQQLADAARHGKHEALSRGGEWRAAVPRAAAPSGPP